MKRRLLRATKFFVVARPIPLVPPMTRAIFPESFEVGEFACITDERSGLRQMFSNAMFLGSFILLVIVRIQRRWKFDRCATSWKSLPAVALIKRLHGFT